MDDDFMRDLHDLADQDADAVLDDLSRVTQEAPEDPVEAEIMESAHVQIRVWKSGPRDAEGRPGDIILEDMQAPIEVARWLASPQCSKRTGPRKRVYIYVDDHLVSNADALPIAEEDDPIRETLPAHQRGEGFTSFGLYQTRLERQIEIAERTAETQLRVLQEQINKAREFRDKEVASCYEAIEAARKRLALELEREDAEIESINQRRVVIANQRADMAGDLNTFGQAMEQVKERLADTTPQPGEGLVDRIAGVIQLANQPEIQSGLEGLIGMYMRTKAKTGG